MRSPLEQFNIKEIIKGEIIGNNMIRITDIGVYIMIGIIALIIIEKENDRMEIRKKLVGKEIRKEIIEKIVRTVVSEKNALILKILFMLILILNIIGMVPYSKTITSELVITMTISIGLLIGITIKGIRINKWRILKILIPENTPILLLPLLTIIETISYLARGISLGLRLGANMIAGHTLLKIIIVFIYAWLNTTLNMNIKIPGISLIDGNNELKINKDSADSLGLREGMEKIREGGYLSINSGEIVKYIITIIPIGILSLIIILEIGVGIMQSLVFTIIAGIYINDVENKIK